MLTVSPVDGVPVAIEPAADEAGIALVARVVLAGDPALVATGIPGLADDAGPSGATGAACAGGIGAPPGAAEPQLPVVEPSSPVPTTSGPGFGYLASFSPTVLHPVPMFATNI